MSSPVLVFLASFSWASKLVDLVESLSLSWT